MTLELVSPARIDGASQHYLRVGKELRSIEVDWARRVVWYETPRGERGAVPFENLRALPQTTDPALTCAECGYLAKSAQGLSLHARKAHKAAAIG